MLCAVLCLHGFCLLWLAQYPISYTPHNYSPSFVNMGCAPLQPELDNTFKVESNGLTDWSLSENRSCGRECAHALAKPVEPQLPYCQHCGAIVPLKKMHRNMYATDT